MSSTIDEKEIEKFTSIAGEWWSANGKFKPLHKFNPARISYIREKLIDNFSLNASSKTPLENLKILDIGCGGGLLCEPLARLGADVTGIDAGKENIEAAKTHAAQSSLNINYRHQTIESLSQTAEKFDVVLAMEIIEHVANVEQFLAAASRCLKPNGLFFIASLNRSATSYLKAIIGAEYVLRWMPRGTHDWKKFLKPSEVNHFMEVNKLKLIDLSGFSYSLLRDEWKASRDISVNYVMTFKN
ncbi:MAG: ubiG [Rickettsiaceae bacterium]|jgi:2-polyprenyl-6-hydroxyphenyl methylase/3-demethylubiquinone-9 3-methyltransferase|nr:ubiG [Rickettsiaceae bacterium]